MAGYLALSEIKLFETLIKVKFIKKSSKLFQYFIFDNAKIAQKVFDKKFSIHDNFENKIREMSLCLLYPESFQFIEKIESEDKITIVSEILKEENEKLFVSYYFTLAGFISKSAGCSTCVYNENGEKEFIQCSLKKKIIPKPVKNCIVFKEKEGLFKT